MNVTDIDTVEPLGNVQLDFQTCKNAPPRTVHFTWARPIAPSAQANLAAITHIGLPSWFEASYQAFHQLLE